MSGGHWNYLSHRLEERAEYAGDVWKLLAAIEHELDWGICCDTCEACAEIRTVRAIKAFFDTDATSVETAIRLVRSDEPECQRCREWKDGQRPRVKQVERGMATLRFEHEGRIYEGTVHEVTR